MTRQTIHTGDLPLVDQLIGASFPPYFEEDCIDPVMKLDDHIWADFMDGNLEALSLEVDELVRRTPDEQTAEQNLQVWLGQSGCPDGTSWLDFLGTVQARVRRGVEHPELLRPIRGLGNSGKRRRFSRFPDKQTANTTATLVLRANEPALRAWAADRGGLWRQHYTADLRQPVGTLTDHTTGFTGEVTAAVVVMKTDHQSGQPFIYDAYPEHVLDPAPRAAFPDLPHLFGAYFGDVPEPPWPAQLNFHVSTSEPARSRIRDQLDDLLTRDDDTLHAALVAFGSHVVPDAHRYWVELLRWRLDAYPWRRAAGLPD